MARRAVGSLARTSSSSISSRAAHLSVMYFMSSCSRSCELCRCSVAGVGGSSAAMVVPGVRVRLPPGNLRHSRRNSPQQEHERRVLSSGRSCSTGNCELRWKRGTRRGSEDRSMGGNSGGPLDLGGRTRRTRGAGGWGGAAEQRTELRGVQVGACWSNAAEARDFSPDRGTCHTSQGAVLTGRARGHKLENGASSKNLAYMQSYANPANPSSPCTSHPYWHAHPHMPGSPPMPGMSRPS